MTIVVRNVFFRHGHGPEVLTNLSLAAAPGELVGLLGANGAGKTTLFNLVVGLLQPASGEIEVAGFSMAAARREGSRCLGYVPDEPLAYPKLSALENLNRFGLLWGVPRSEIRERSESLLREAGLWEERNIWAEAYSRGMRQKLSLCCALLHRPRVLILDEPFNGLDLGATLWLRSMLQNWVKAGGCALLSSHQPEALDALSDRLLVLRDRRILRDLDRAALSGEGGSAAVFRQAQAAEQREAAS